VIVGVLLAAGASTRMGSPKALVKSRGQSFLVRGVRALWAVCDTVVVVLGADGEKVCETAGQEFESLVAKGMLAPDLRGGPRDRSGELEVRFAFNKLWAEGMLSSVRVGLAAALKHRPRGILLQPVDHPDVKPATVQSLGAMLDEALGAFGGKKSAGFAYALVPRHRGRRGHPVALSAGLATSIARDRVATDLSDGIRRHARLVGYLDVADKGVTVNHNTPAGAGSAARAVGKGGRRKK
jgi:CTP:molybdopterin cytidylyltransferase MocA